MTAVPGSTPTPPLPPSPPPVPDAAPEGAYEPEYDTAYEPVREPAPGPGEPPTHALNLSSQTRLGLYLFSALGSIFVAYASAKGWAWIGEAEIGAWSSLVALINGLAAMNVRSGPNVSRL